MTNIFLNIKNVFIGTRRIQEYIFTPQELEGQTEYSSK